jgi:hypothetical protein
VWRIDWLIIAAVAGALLLRCFPRPIEVPGRNGGVEWVLVPVAPVALASLVPTIVSRTWLPLERISGRFDHRGRVGLVVTMMAICTAAIAAGVGEVRRADVRNCALAISVSLVAVHVVPAALSWAPVLGVGIVTWLVGVPGPGQAPPGWAVLLAPGASQQAMWITVGAAAVAVVLFVVRTPRADAED